MGLSGPASPRHHCASLAALQQPFALPNATPPPPRRAPPAQEVFMPAAPTLSASWRPSSTARLKGSFSAFRSFLALSGVDTKHTRTARSRACPASLVPFTLLRRLPALHGLPTTWTKPSHLHIRPCLPACPSPAPPLACSQQLLQNLWQQAALPAVAHEPVAAGALLAVLRRHDVEPVAAVCHGDSQHSSYTGLPPAPTAPPVIAPTTKSPLARARQVLTGPS